MSDRPRPFEGEAFRSICSELEPGEYSFTTVKEEVEGSVSRFVRSASTNMDFAGLLAMSSTSSASPQPIGGVQPRPDCQVISIRRLRPDHGSPEYHVNVDDSLLFEDEDGNVWIHSPERDDHYDSSVSRDAGLDGILRQYKLENVPPRGSIDDLRERGVLVSFTT
jgi:hypothetical protein